MLVVALLVIAVVGYFYMQSPETDKDMNANPAPTSSDVTPPVTNPSNPQTPSTNPTTPSTPQSLTVDITGFAFSPATLTIHVGDSVTWTNKDSASHTVTSNAGSELNSSTLGKDQSYSHTFNTAGTYAYHCAFHSGMKATVIVQ